MAARHPEATAPEGLCAPKEALAAVAGALSSPQAFPKSRGRDELFEAVRRGVQLTKCFRPTGGFVVEFQPFSGA